MPHDTSPPTPAGDRIRVRGEFIELLAYSAYLPTPAGDRIRVRGSTLEGLIPRQALADPGPARLVTPTERKGNESQTAFPIPHANPRPRRHATNTSLASLEEGARAHALLIDNRASGRFAAQVRCTVTEEATIATHSHRRPTARTDRLRGVTDMQNRVATPPTDANRAIQGTLCRHRTPRPVAPVEKEMRPDPRTVGEGKRFRRISGHPIEGSLVEAQCIRGASAQGAVTALGVVEVEIS